MIRVIVGGRRRPRRPGHDDGAGATSRTSSVVGGFGSANALSRAASAWRPTPTCWSTSPRVRPRRTCCARPPAGLARRERHQRSIRRGARRGWTRRLRKRQRGGVWAANFAIGGALMMHFARVAARFMDAAEVIELHHDRKSTRRRERPSRPPATSARPATPTCPIRRRALDPRRLARRGAGRRAHPQRALPGFNAHQEVLFGSLGQVLSIRHDALGRDAYLPGVALAVREVPKRRPRDGAGYTMGLSCSDQPLALGWLQTRLC